MNFIARAWVAVAFVATAAPASAHPVFGVTGFAGGLLHALLVPTHLMAVVALALLIGQQRRGRGAVIAYAAAIIAGLGAIALAYVPTRAEEGVLAAAASAGLLVALARPLPRSVGVLLAGAVGLAVALDSPPETISLRDANLALLGTRSARCSCFWLCCRWRRASRAAGSVSARASSVHGLPPPPFWCWRCGLLARRSRPCAARLGTARG